MNELLQENIYAIARSMVRALDGNVTDARVEEKAEVGWRLHDAFAERQHSRQEMWRALDGMKAWQIGSSRFDPKDPYHEIMGEEAWAIYAADHFSDEATAEVQKNRHSEQVTENEANFRDATGKKSGVGQSDVAPLYDIWPIICEFTERRKPQDSAAGRQGLGLVAGLLGFDENQLANVADTKLHEKRRRARGHYWNDWDSTT